MSFAIKKRFVAFLHKSNGKTKKYKRKVKKEQ